MSSLLTSADFSRLRLEWLWVYQAPVAVDVPEKWSREIVVPNGVFFVLQGLAKIEVGGRVYEIGPGMAFVGAQGVRRQWFEEGTRLLSVGFRAAWVHHGPLLGDGTIRVVPAGDVEELMRQTARLHRTVNRRRREVGFRAAVQPRSLPLRDWMVREQAFREWFMICLQTLEALNMPLQFPVPVEDARLAQVLKQLDEWPLHRKLDLGELAGMAGQGIGRRRMEQLMRLHAGVSPAAYLERRRLASACEQLLSTTRPLKELAHDLGFRHASHFTKWFQRATGLAPSRYRSSGVGLA